MQRVNAVLIFSGHELADAEDAASAGIVGVGLDIARKRRNGLGEERAGEGGAPPVIVEAFERWVPLRGSLEKGDSAGVVGIGGGDCAQVVVAVGDCGHELIAEGLDLAQGGCIDYGSGAVRGGSRVGRRKDAST